MSGRCAYFVYILRTTFSKQCAAVRTYLSLMMVPAQKPVSPSASSTMINTIHGHSFSSASSPPKILLSSGLRPPPPGSGMGACLPQTGWVPFGQAPHSLRPPRRAEFFCPQARVAGGSSTPITVHKNPRLVPTMFDENAKWMFSPACAVQETGRESSFRGKDWI